jgi:hypothetical protein
MSVRMQEQDVTVLNAINDKARQMGNFTNKFS